MSKHDALETLLEFLRTQRGFDFTGYKRSTLSRRIHKRMLEVEIEDYAAYQDYLEVHPEEFEALFNTILINVTGFFRDAEAWERLRTDVLPEILKIAGPRGQVRVWSASCASGEESYTIAILLAEALGIEAFQERVKIYATDVDEEALAQARLGIYSEEKVEAVPEALRDRYFERAGNRYAFRNDLRRNVIFGRIDLVQNAPISRLHLLVCRNTLMYFNQEAQARILANFHFALRDDGFLFLGKAEMLLTHGHLFRPANLSTRIFRKVSKPDLRERLLLLSQSARNPSDSDGEPDPRLRAAAFDMMPAAQVILDTKHRLVLANEPARQLFGLRENDLGRLLQDLEFSYRPIELRSRIEQAEQERRALEPVVAQRHLPNGTLQHLEVRVAPLLADDVLLGIAATFHDVSEEARLQEDLRTSRSELETAFEELQSTNEELETTNEELQSTIEELETTNEELQSTNEELETMNEELQSTNEELETMNEELRRRTDESRHISALMETIFASLHPGVVLLNEDLRVTLWSERARQLWGLSDQEVVGELFFGLDMGLPTAALRVPVEAARTGEERYVTAYVNAVNRRGRPVRCRVVCSALQAPDEHVQGVLLMMEEWDSKEAGGEPRVM